MTCYIVLSDILHKKSPFRHGIAPNAFLFMAIGRIRLGTLVTQLTETVALCKHKADAPLLLVEILRRGQSATTKGHRSKRDLLQDRSYGKL